LVPTLDENPLQEGKNLQDKSMIWFFIRRNL